MVTKRLDIIFSTSCALERITRLPKDKKNLIYSMKREKRNLKKN
jgi:hypothetical protein